MSSPAIQRRSPYQGLTPYSEADASFFFGREKETRLIIANLFASPLTILYGGSGVGKSSVLRAGVAYQLDQREDLLVVVFNAWQSNPASDLGQAIADQAALADYAAWKKAVRLLPEDRPATLAELLSAVATQLNRRLMIILDQFEEYFLYHLQDDTFSDEFPAAVLQTEAPVNFLISIREDAVAKLDRFEGRIPNLFDNYFRIEHLDRKAARTAIIKPIEEFNRGQAPESQVALEPLLVDTVLDQVQAGQVTLGETGRGIIQAESSAGQIETPYLQLVMTRLWDEEMCADSRVLRLRTLKNLGSAERIVRTHLDTTMNALPAEEKDIAAEVFHYLVTPSGTKIAHTVPDLADYAGVSSASIAPVMEELAGGDMRVLRGVSPPPDQPSQPRYEIFHDVLAAAVLDWRARYAQEKQVLRTKAEAERKLKEAQVEAERQLAVERSARMLESARRLRLGLVAALLLVLMLSGVTVVAFIQTRKAREAAENVRQVNEKLEKAYKELGKEKEKVENKSKEVEKENQKFEEQRGIAENQRSIAEERAAEAVTAQHQAIAARELADNATRRAIFAAETEKQNRMGLGEARAGHALEAIRLFEKAYGRYNIAGDRSGQVSALSNIGETYADLGGIPSFSALYELLESEDSGEQTTISGGSLVAYLEFFGGIMKQASAKSQDAANDLADARVKAASSYAHALVMNNKSDLKNEALILKRLGDISIIQYTEKSGADAAEGAESYLKQGIDYYVRAADAYHKASLSSTELSIRYDEANVLRTVAEGLYGDIDNQVRGTVPPKDASVLKKQFDQVIGYYERAAKAFAAAKRTYQEAAILSKIGSVYKDGSKLYGTGPKALEYYGRVAKIYDDVARPELAAPVYVTIAQFGIEQRIEVDEILAAYKLAFEAYIQAASHTKEKVNYYNQADATLRSIVKFSNSLTAEQKKKSDALFLNVTSASQDPARESHLLKVIAGEYLSEYPAEKQDKARAILYLQRASKTSAQAGRFFEAASIAFDAVNLYVPSQDKPNLIQSFDDAINLYRQSQELAPDGTPMRARLVSQLANAARAVDEVRDQLRAVDGYEEVLKLSPPPGLPASNSLYRLVTIYIERKDGENGERVIRTMLEQAKNPEDKALALRNIGDSYVAAKQYSEAVSYFEKSFALYQDAYEHTAASGYQKDTVRIGAVGSLRKASTLLGNQFGGSKAVNYLIEFANAAAQSQNLFREATARQALADLHDEAANKEQLPAEKSKQLDSALASYALARAAYHSLHDKQAEANVMKQMSKVYAAKGDRATADQLNADAAKLLQSN